MSGYIEMIGQPFYTAAMVPAGPVRCLLAQRLHGWFTRPACRRPHGHSRLYRLHHAAMALLTVLAMLSGYSMAQSEDTSVQAVKAAFAFNFAKFTTWPSDRFATATSPIVLCIYKDSFATEVTKPLETKSLQERPVQVITVSGGDFADCHLLYIAARYVQGDLASGNVAGAPPSVLTVSDHEDFARAGGHIGLLESDGRLRFQINLDKVEKSRLSLSSKLLKLAEIVGKP